MTSAIDRRLAEARSRIKSVPPAEAQRLKAAGALFVDTRRREQRDEFGVIPGSIVIDRNVLEWRLDPTSAHRDPTTAEHHGPIVVYCQQGYSSDPGGGRARLARSPRRLRPGGRLRRLGRGRPADRGEFLTAAGSLGAWGSQGPLSAKRTGRADRGEFLTVKIG